MHTLPESAVRRRAGRPSRLSRELVLAAALELLGDEGTDHFSIAKLGKRLNATAMSIYTYFPSRDALLEAVAENIFARFEPPPVMDRWQDYILEWLRSITLLFDRFPVALQVLAWDGHISVSWLRAWLPVMRVLQEQESDPKTLGAISDWFLTATIGFINAHRNGPKRMMTLPEEVLERLDSEDRRLLEEMRQYQGGPNENWRLEYAFRNIIDGLEALVGNAGPPAK